MLGPFQLLLAQIKPLFHSVVIKDLKFGVFPTKDRPVVKRVVIPPPDADPPSDAISKLISVLFLLSLAPVNLLPAQINQLFRPVVIRDLENNDNISSST